MATLSKIEPDPLESKRALSDRYSRQVLFAGIGEAGQRRLGAAHVALVGCGATGAAAASLLARAGVGTLTIIDRDFVEESNLQRQVLFDEADARESLPKAEAAKRKIALFNSEVAVNAHVKDLTPGNIHELLAGADLILDATDNFEARYLVNDYAVEQGKPWIYSAAVGAYAVTMNILPGETACLACIFPEPPTGTVETCDTAGILNSAVNLAASLAVTEAIKFVIGAQDRLRRTAALLRPVDERVVGGVFGAPASRLRGVPGTGFPASARRGAATYYALRAKFGADSRTWTAGGLQ